MLRVTEEGLRVCRGPVFWVAAGWTKGRNYQPGPEGLMYRWWELGGECHAYRPTYWHRSSIPGSGGTDYFRSDVELIMCFKRPGELPWSDNTACGHKPKFRGGGACTNRLPDGTRVYRAPKGVQGSPRERQKYIPPERANPGNLIETIDRFPMLIRSKVGGGHMGDELAYKSEAPFPEDLPERFILSFCPPGGRVLDPFGGSGTTAAVARRWGRSAVSLDIRPSQAAIARKRVSKVTSMFPSVIEQVPPADQMTMF